MRSKTKGLEPHTEFLWSRADYEELVRQGVFGPEDNIELLNGKLITMAPQNSPHRTALNLVRVYLDGVFSSASHVAVQCPLALDDRSLPEPDVAVIPGNIRDYTDHHPSRALLIVEIADSSLEYDRGLKLKSYARAGIPEYWIVNLPDEQVEVYRSPAGERYRDGIIARKGEHIRPAECPGHSIDVAELLP